MACPGKKHIKLMASIVPGYEYDIFISYRHNDNRSGWVTEFVSALQEELAATIKEPVSIYFDTNPHDGLLETHDVDGSLKEKIKCLVFVPIVSQTFCDPDSFAWQNEFLPFLDFCKTDNLGLDIRLPGGNVTKRVLPVRIHEIESADKKLFESELGGIMRPIDFIYKETGVNRPLMPSDDRTQNLGKTDYRNQVNKLANSIKDILGSLATKELPGDDAMAEIAGIEVDKSTSLKSTRRKNKNEISSISLFYRLRNHVTLNRNAWKRVVLVLFILAVSSGAFWLGLENAPSPTIRAQFRSDIPLTQNLGRVGRKAIAISPDGEFLAYVMNEELNLISLNSNEPSFPIPGTANGRNPFFSPDGKWIGFDNHLDKKIMKVPLKGGIAILICDMESWGTGISWHENEIIFAVEGGSIYRVPDSGGSPELIYSMDNPQIIRPAWNPQLLPDNKTLFFSQFHGDGSVKIVKWRIGSKESPVILVDNASGGRYLKSGHIAYIKNKHLHVSKFDPKKNRIYSESTVIETGVILDWFGAAQFDLSDNGILVYYEEQAVSKNHLVWIDDSGVISPITREAENYGAPAISSDAQSIAVEVTSVGNNSRIEIINTDLGTTRLFVEKARSPVWSKDNSSIFYINDSNQVFQKPVDESTPAQLLSVNLDAYNRGLRSLENLSPDGRFLMFEYSLSGRGREIGYYDMINDTVEMMVYNTILAENDPAISPDGKWIAYASNYDGQFEIFVAPFPGPGQRTPVSVKRETGDAMKPVWSQDMNTLYYVTDLPDYEIWEVKTQTSEKFSHGEPMSIFKGDKNLILNDLEIHPNGHRFLGTLIQENGSQEYGGPAIKVIVNWDQVLVDKK